MNGGEWIPAKRKGDKAMTKQELAIEVIRRLEKEYPDAEKSENE